MVKLEPAAVRAKVPGCALIHENYHNTKDSTIEENDRDEHPHPALVIISPGSASKAVILHFKIKVMDGTTIYSDFSSFTKATVEIDKDCSKKTMMWKSRKKSICYS